MTDRPRTIEERVEDLELAVRALQTVVYYTKWAIGILIMFGTMIGSIWQAMF